MKGKEFDKPQHYAYLRQNKGETLLVVVNFHDREQQMRVQIPNDAFVYLNLEGKTNATGKDLLSGKTYNLDFVPDGVLDIVLPAWKGVILKIK